MGTGGEMDSYSEYDVRLAEQYRMAYKRKDAHSTLLAGWICIAGLILALSASVFGGADMDPRVQGTMGGLLFIGGGVYWIHARDSNRRAQSEVERIESYFRQKKMTVTPDGLINRRATAPVP